MLVYITNNNFSKITRTITIREINLEGDLYERYNKVLNAIFSKFEKTELLLHKIFSEDPEKFLKEIYSKVTLKEDSYTWVYEEKRTPCYHFDSNCPRLNSDFENYQIPLSIKYKKIETDIPFEYITFNNLSESEQNVVKENVKQYREWWKNVGEHLYKSDINKFLMRVNMKFQPNPRITDIREFKWENSGITDFDNCTLPEIENKIDSIIEGARSFYYENEKHSYILQHYIKYSYNILVKNEFPTFVESNFTNEDIKSVIENYNNKFKKPLKNLLKNYFRIKNNPDLKMEDRILEELGFVPCGNCYNFSTKEVKSDSFVKEHSINNEYEKFLELFLDTNNLSFAKTYISMYYPFTYSEILERWDYIIQGDAHYSTYIVDIEDHISPKIGLSFNTNIRWNNKLKAKYEYGYINPFIGCIVGTHKGQVEFNERDYIYDILPLDLIKEIEIRNDIVFDNFLDNLYMYIENDFDGQNLPNPKTYDMNLIKKTYLFLPFKSFKKLFDETPYIVMFNKSIWDNTFSKIINLDFCDKVLGFHK